MKSINLPLVLIAIFFITIVSIVTYHCVTFGIHCSI